MLLATCWRLATAATISKSREEAAAPSASAPEVAEFEPPAAEITLYASSRDKALLASRTFHGYARAGDAGGGLVVMSGIETIDASATDTSLLGHSYYGDACSVLSDLYHLVREGKRAPQRFALQTVETLERAYWIFRP